MKPHGVETQRLLTEVALEVEPEVGPEVAPVIEQGEEPRDPTYEAIWC